MVSAVPAMVRNLENLGLFNLDCLIVEHIIPTNIRISMNL